MKKYFLILGMMISALGIWSCNNDDDVYANFHYVARGIDSIAMPDSARLGQRVEVRTYTTVLQNCQQFQSHGYDIVGNERTVTAWFVEFDNQECGDELAFSPYFYFAPQHSGTFQFRFWAGQDDETDEDIFITKEINIYE